jgi:hypothetical protein
MRAPWSLLLFGIAGYMYAGTLTGVVLEHASGRPLSRTVVRLQAVPSMGSVMSQPLITRTSQSGQFVFATVPSGTYLLTAMRNAYFPAAFGQRLPAGRGAPISIGADSTHFAELRMRHKGALTGRVLDENGVGSPGVPVVAYRARLPLRTAGSSTSDDRGVFRIGGLEPGKYWVRSGAHTLEDHTGWLPTFAPQESEIRNARLFRVTVDADTTDADVNPQSGALFSLSGWITCQTAGPVVITLTSDTSERTGQTFCGPDPGSYQFQGLPGGAYEVFASAQDGHSSAFKEFTLAGNLQVNLSLAQSPEVQIEVLRAGGGPLGSAAVKLLGRRQNLSETGSPVEITGPRANLGPGFWEMRANVPPDQYVQSIMNVRTGRQGRRNSVSPADWFQVFIDPGRQSIIRVTVSDQAAKITGRVITEGRPAPGAPVFLWPVGEGQRRSLGGRLQATTDTEGAFQFDSLPPGEYSVLASFDVSEVDEETIDRGRALAAQCDAGKTSVIELPLWVAY